MNSILFLNHNIRGHGTWWRNFHLAQELATRGWRTTVWTVSPKRQWWPWVQQHPSGVRIVETPWLTSRWLAANGMDPWDCWWRWRQARQFVRTKEFSAVFASDHLPNVSLPALAARKNVSFIADWADLFTRGGLREKYNRWPTRWLYRLEAWLELMLKRRANRCSAISPLLLERLREEAGVPLERCLLLPNGCQANPSAARLSCIEARRKLGLPEAGFRIGVLASQGKLTTQELRELAALAQRTTTQTSGLVWIDLIGPFSKKIQQRLKLFVQDSVQLNTTGWIEPSKLHERLQACDVGWVWDTPTTYHASRHPTRLAAWLEAGRPVLVNPIGFYAKALVEAGAAVSCTSITRLAPMEAAALDRLLNSLEVRKAAGQAAFAWAQKDGSWESVGRRFAAWLDL